MTRAEFVQAWNKNFDSLTHCFYCGEKFRWDGSAHSPFRRTKEHIIPQVAMKGFKKAANNQVWACAGCNNAKNGGTISEFRQWFGNAFYSETVLNLPLPEEYFTIRNIKPFDKLIQDSYSRQKSAIVQRLNGKRLNQLLHNIVQEAWAGTNLCKTSST